MNSVIQGGTRRIQTTTPFAVSGVATDPTTVTLEVRKGDGTEVTYTYAGGGVQKAGTGDYYRDITFDVSGVWTYAWIGTGAAAQKDEDQIYVIASAFPT